ncbi:MAG: hypothetical protein JWM10_4161 [Myxococcaceae bacterium]|nr:hypothetical protein [Myxococcaceae bacterium]
MTEFHLLALVVTLFAGFVAGVGLRSWQARDRNAFRPLVPPAARRPWRSASPTRSANGSHLINPTADELFVPLMPQAQREPGAPCFTCGSPLDEGEHDHSS